MKTKIFNSNILLNFKDFKLESSFLQNVVHTALLKYNWINTLIIFLLSITDCILESCFYHQLTILKVRNVVYTLYLSYAITALYLIFFLLSIFIKTLTLQKIISYTNFILLTIPFSNIRKTLLDLEIIEVDIFTMFRTLELLMRICMILLMLVNFPTGFFIIFITVCLSCLYIRLRSGPYSILQYIVQLLFLLIICHFYNKQVKLNFYNNLKISNRNKWYNNIIENMNTGFFSLKKMKLKKINHNMREIFEKSIEINELLKQSNEDGLVNLGNSEKSTLSENEYKNTNAEGILKVILNNIRRDYIQDEHDRSNNENFDLKLFLNGISNTDQNEKFVFLGYKTLDIINNHKSVKKELSRNQKKSKTFEVFYRCSDSTIVDNYDLEFIFNDITAIKNYEEQNANIKYKSMFLSKIAHEFKNPLISISELSEQFQENPNDKTKLLQIKNLSEYLQMMIKDLNYFSILEIDDKSVNSEELQQNHMTSLDETLQFCNNIGQALLMKFNKTNIISLIIKNQIGEINFYTDSNKLKQVLSNLLSNAVKFTNTGSIIVRAFKNKSDFITFEVSDTGCGINEDLAKRILKGANFVLNEKGEGLGFYIIIKIIEQLNSKLMIESHPERGSKLYFEIKLKDKEELDNKKSHLEHLNENIVKENNIYELNMENNECDGNNVVLIANEQSSSINFKNRKESSSCNTLKDSFRQYVKYNVNSKASQIIIRDEVLNDFDLNISRSHSADSRCADEMIYDRNKSYYVFVDDEMFTRMSSVRVFKKTAKKYEKNIEVFESDDGLDCLYLVYKLISKGFKISGIVSDEMMKFMNGSYSAEVLKKLKNLNTERIPFTLLTAYPNVKSQFVDLFISKPLDETRAKSILIPDN